jgi:toxin YoeB
MRQLWTERASDDFDYWEKHNQKIAEKIRTLIKDIRENDPFKGLGKPEPLKEDLSGWWSRRITLDDRLVYRLRGPKGGQTLEIASCRYHY